MLWGFSFEEPAQLRVTPGKVGQRKTENSACDLIHQNISSACQRTHLNTNAKVAEFDMSLSID